MTTAELNARQLWATWKPLAFKSWSSFSDWITIRLCECSHIMWWLVGLHSFLSHCAKICINVSGAPVWTKPGSQVPSTTCTTQLLMDQWWQEALSSTPEGCQAVRRVCVCVCVCVSECIFLCMHICLWQANCLPEVQSSLYNYQTHGVVNKLVCVYEKCFEFTKCVCQCVLAFICVRPYCWGGMYEVTVAYIM